jgi:integration host factor subunit alpha
VGLSKKDIINTIAVRKFLSNNEAHHSVEKLVEIIKSTLESGEDVMVSNFGRFCVKEKASRKGRNPETGETMIIPSRRVVTFKCSGKLRERLNKNS